MSELCVLPFLSIGPVATTIAISYFRPVYKRINILAAIAAPLITTIAYWTATVVENGQNHLYHWLPDVVVFLMIGLFLSQLLLAVVTSFIFQALSGFARKKHINTDQKPDKEKGGAEDMQHDYSTSSTYEDRQP